ncbi:MAG: 1,4-alpha-glucan branching protein GlgB [Acidobacteriota bacterium]
MKTPFLSDFDLHLIAEGSHFQTWEKLGAHVAESDQGSGVHFAVWAPNADRVSVIGDFNRWDKTAHPMELREEAGIWEAFVPGIGAGALYKYRISNGVTRYQADKADPYGFAAELRPETASKVCTLDGYDWGDRDWIKTRDQRQSLASPISIYEAHLGSWMRVREDHSRWMTYREIAPRLADYLHEMGYTHVELLPMMEHPFDGSWGYQTIGYFAPTSRFGSPQDFMFLVDYLHQRGIGVILDWVPAHFPRDEHGLAYFDGTHLYEHADARQGQNPEWNTFVFNYGRNEVRNFLVSNALFWMDMYHVDGLRVDAVASMLYLDYARSDGQWVANRYGGRENLEAVEFLKLLNDRVYAKFPGAMMIAEESTAWPMVSRPASDGGLGFGFKWNMGWMHDMLEYMSQDPINRSYHHDRLTFSMVYAFSENFILPFSHDEVVYGKRSMIGKMPGDDWQKFANLRLLYGFMFTHPGKKLLFMGNDIGQWSEWNHDSSIDWQLLEFAPHSGLQRWVRDLNTAYRGTPALYEKDYDPGGFEWVDCADRQQSVISFLRRDISGDQVLLCVCNFTPVPRWNYRLGIPYGGYWKEVLNSDAALYGGSGLGNQGGAEASPTPLHGRPFSLSLCLPPLGIVVLSREITS